MLAMHTKKLFSPARVLALIGLLALILTSCGGSGGSSGSAAANRPLSVLENLRMGNFPTSFSAEVLNEDATLSYRNFETVDELYRYQWNFTEQGEFAMKKGKLYFIIVNPPNKRELVISDLTVPNPTITSFGGVFEEGVDTNPEDPPSLQTLDLNPNKLAVDEEWLYVSDGLNYVSDGLNLVRFKLDTLDKDQLAVDDNNMMTTVMQKQDFTQILPGGEALASLKLDDDYLYLRTNDEVEDTNTNFFRFNISAGLETGKIGNLEAIACTRSSNPDNLPPIELNSAAHFWGIIGSHIYAMRSDNDNSICSGEKNELALSYQPINLDSTISTHHFDELDYIWEIIDVFDRAYMLVDSTLLNGEKTRGIAVINNNGKLEQFTPIPKIEITLDGEPQPREIDLQPNSLVFDEQTGAIYALEGIARDQGGSESGEVYIVKLTPGFD